ncbi:MAG: hypothetical protein DRQ89_13085 [Epsilonproteobacteria bacterium]|nr:MAG: hypothetical protein DRQ89_13085 [Campylobacterota bacterium]
MNNSNRWEKFAGSIGMTSAKLKAEIWYDFEEFIIKGIITSSTDSRLFTSLFFVVKSSINILSPNKLYKVANKFFNKNKEWKILCFMIDNSLEETRSKTQWGNFLKKTSKNITRRKEQLFSVKAFRENKLFLKWYLSADNIDLENKNKYLNERLFLSHPLIRSRLLGTKIVYSDIIFFKSLCDISKMSLRKLSSIIYHDPAQICEAMGNLVLVT